MNRFFVEKSQIKENEIEILGDDVKHIKNVLRLKEGQELELVCDSLVYLVEIELLGSKNILTKILGKSQGENESKVDLYLYQGIAKGSKMDMIIQKNTELGVKKIYPIETNRTVVKLKGDKKVKSRLERWNQIAVEASKQSKRDVPSRVEEILDFKGLIEHLKGEKYIIVPYELENTRALKGALEDFKGDQAIHVIIGPEGGFEDYEIEELEKIAARPVTLGPRILRTETAGLVANTICLYEFGDLGVR